MNSKTYFSNFLWRLMERWGAQGVSFIVSVVLARLLSPSVYGEIALVTVLITLLDTFLDSGLGNSLIQKKQADDLDFSSVFYFNIIFSLFLYFLLFMFAPAFSRFYGIEELTSVIRIMGLSVIISGIKNIQQAYISRNMQFKLFFIATSIGTITAAIVGIYMAYRGFGVWALVSQYLVNNFIDTAILWFLVKWRPKFVFSLSRLKRLLSFGWKLLLSNLIYTGYTELRQLLVGKFFTSSDLAYYNQGYKIPNLISTNINTSIKSITFPAMSSVQENPERVKGMLRRTIQVTQYVIGPVVLGLAACANPLVKLVFTEKWLPCVPYLRLFCLAFMFGQMGTANMNATVAVGRSDLRLKIEIGKTLVDVIVLIITVFISPLAIAIGYVLCTLVRCAICAWPNSKLIGYSFFQQMLDILPNLINGIVMAGIVWTITFLHLPSIITLLIQIPLGTVIYIGLSYISKSEAFFYICDLLKSYLYKKKEVEK